ncbi:MAG: VWA domain-containing protein [Gemmatales bacterium]|nr:VWA domain-containing protein [Gemmatales bacterium]MDW8385647.1 VWA domain-containing protein [Gemmatales bacterium]
MHFANPLWLLLLVTLPLLAWWWLRRPRAAFRYSATAGIATEIPQSSRWANVFSLGLRLAIVSLLILGLARPRWPDLSTRLPARSVALVFVLDVSGSMAEQDLERDGQRLSRLSVAKDVLRRFVIGDGQMFEGRPEDLLGLITFAARVEQICPPSLGHQALLRTLDGAEPLGVPPDSATNIGDAMAIGIQLLRGTEPKEKVLVVLSDGEHNVPPDVVPNALKPRQAARLAQALGVRVHAVFVGSGEEATAVEAEQSLRDVAAYTGGKAFRAADAEAFQEVCRQIDQLERTPIQTFQYLRWHEAYPWLGLAAAVLLTTLITLEMSRFRRLP